MYSRSVPGVDGERLRSLREGRVFTLHELSGESGVSYNTIYRLEHGKTGAHPRTIRKLAGALGVEAEYLVKQQVSQTGESKE